MRYAWLLAAVGVLVAQAQSLSGDALVSALRGGGYVIVMRHASSPRTPPPEVNADNVNHERQLDADGRAAATAMGEALQRLRIPLGQVLISPTYRALETARLARFNMPTVRVELGEGAEGMQVGSGTRGEWLRRLAAIPPQAGTDTLIITHFPNITEAFPHDTSGLGEGEALVVHPEHGAATVVARLKMSDWPHLGT
jgi:phosphohistidine phosphatase SixA